MRTEGWPHVGAHPLEEGSPHMGEMLSHRQGTALATPSEPNAPQGTTVTTIKANAVGYLLMGKCCVFIL